LLVRRLTPPFSYISINRSRTLLVVLSSLPPPKRNSPSNPHTKDDRIAQNILSEPAFWIFRRPWDIDSHHLTYSFPRSVCVFNRDRLKEESGRENHTSPRFIDYLRLGPPFSLETLVLVYRPIFQHHWIHIHTIRGGNPTLTSLTTPTPHQHQTKPRTPRCLAPLSAIDQPSIRRWGPGSGSDADARDPHSFAAKRCGVYRKHS